jgi:hypothetical protein
VTLDDNRVAAPRKFYVDGVPVYIVGEQAFELDAEDNVLRTVTFTDYVRDHVRRLSPTAEHLRETWPIAEQRIEIVAALEQRGSSGLSGADHASRKRDALMCCSRLNTAPGSARDAPRNCGRAPNFNAHRRPQTNEPLISTPMWACAVDDCR